MIIGILPMEAGRVGSTAVSRLYLGATQVWPSQANAFTVEITGSGVKTDSLGTYAEIGDQANISVTADPPIVLGPAQATAANALGPFVWTVDDTVVNVNAAADFTVGENTLTYTAAGLPAGVSISSAGLITGTPTAVSSGTIIVTGTDEFARTTTSTTTYSTSLRAAATATSMSDQTFTVDTAVNLDLTTVFTANGNTLTYAITSLPAGLVDDGDGTISGTPTGTGSGTITITATDEYGRSLARVFSYTTNPAADTTAPTVVSESVTVLLNGDLSYAITGLSEDATGYYAIVPTGDAAPTFSGTTWTAGAASTLSDTFTQAITVGGGPYEVDIVDGLSGNFDIYRVLIDGLGNATAVTQIGTNLSIDSTAPTISSVSTNEAGDQITLTFSEALTNTATDHTDFTMTGHTLSSFAGSGTTWAMAVSPAVAFGDVDTLAYNAATGDLADASGNVLASFSQAITNTVPAPPSGPTFADSLPVADYTSSNWGSRTVDVDGWLIAPATSVRADSLGSSPAWSISQTGIITAVVDLRVSSGQVGTQVDMRIWNVTSGPNAQVSYSLFNAVLSQGNTTAAGVIDMGGGVTRFYAKISANFGDRIILDLPITTETATDFKNPSLFEGDLTVSEITGLS